MVKILCGLSCLWLSVGIPDVVADELASNAVSAERAMNLQPASFRLTMETLTLPAKEHMGLAGIHFVKKVSNQWYGGIAAFGAVTGERGGFFTGGFDVGWKQPLYSHGQLDIGLFAGGGGGGAAPQGGGMMLRPHAGLIYDLDSWHVGIQYSQVIFPNGDIDSEQLAFTFERPLEYFSAPGWLTRINWPAEWGADDVAQVSHQQRQFGLRFATYQPVAGTRDTGGKAAVSAMGLIGFALDRQIGKHGYSSIQTAGAMTGSTDGFAELFWLWGWQTEITETWRWRNSLALGAAGGGGVATGGGLVTRAMTGLHYQASNGWQAHLEAGYMDAVEGDFAARVVALQLGYAYDVPTLNQAVNNAELSQWQARHWQLRSGLQTYIPYADTRRKGSLMPDDRRVDLVGVKVDLMTTDKFYLSGQALGAFDGGAGGYAAGLVGPGWRQPLDQRQRWHVMAEMLFGAGGGGGLAVGGGLLLQPMLGLGYQFNEAWGLALAVGDLQAVDGSFKAQIIDCSIVYRLTTPVARR